MFSLTNYDALTDQLADMMHQHDRACSRNTVLVYAQIDAETGVGTLIACEDSAPADCGILVTKLYPLYDNCVAFLLEAVGSLDAFEKITGISCAGLTDDDIDTDNIEDCIFRQSDLFKKVEACWGEWLIAHVDYPQLAREALNGVQHTFERNVKLAETRDRLSEGIVNYCILDCDLRVDDKSAYYPGIAYDLGRHRIYRNCATIEDAHDWFDWHLCIKDDYSDHTNVFEYALVEKVDGIVTAVTIANYKHGRFHTQTLETQPIPLWKMI